MSDELNGLDAKIEARGFFERILRERDRTEAERQARLDERFAAQEKAIAKAEARLDSTMKGFPQEYARKIELEQMRTNLDTTADVLAQKVVDSAVALATAQERADGRADTRMKKMEDYQSRLTGIALAAPVLTAIIVYLLTRK